MWKNNNFFIGLLASFLLTMAASAMVIFLGPLVYKLFSQYQPENKLLLLAFAPGILLMRWYMRKLKFTNAGSGAMVIVFLFVILYFVFIDGKPFSIFFY